ncbi:MAG: hypothetical protein EOP42_21190, partial [Sphingobacteriaceae bacterium]
MKDKVSARIFSLQKKLLGIQAYTEANGNALFKYSIEFESVLSLLIRTDNQKFRLIYEDYYKNTQVFCRLCCEFYEENNRYQAFSAGFNKLYFYLGECLKILAEHDYQPQTNVKSPEKEELLPPLNL